jgi:hypothetical protein
MRFTSGKIADARDADRRSLIFLLRRYGRSRSGLLSIRPPNWHPDDGVPRHSSWENRLIFCLDVEMVLASMASPRHRFILQQCYATDRNQRDVARVIAIPRDFWRSARWPSCTPGSRKVWLSTRIVCNSS